MGNKELSRKAHSLYLEGLKLIEIASQLNVPVGTIRSWKNRQKWETERRTMKCNATQKCNVAKIKYGRGKNPKSHHNGTGPPGNQNALRHGLFSKWLPDDIQEISNLIDDDPLEILWNSVKIQFAVIIKAQQIMYVENKQDKTKEITMDGSDVTAYEIQQSWDKQATYLNSQSKAMTTLAIMIERYINTVEKTKGLQNELHKARIEILKAQVDKLRSNSTNDSLEKLDELIKNISEVAKDDSD